MGILRSVRRCSRGVVGDWLRGSNGMCCVGERRLRRCLSWDGRCSVRSGCSTSDGRTIGRGKSGRDTSGGAWTCCSGLGSKGYFASIEFHMAVKGIFTGGGLGDRDKGHIFDMDR